MALVELRFWQLPIPGLSLCCEFILRVRGKLGG